jgi:hypothetical protein
MPESLEELVRRFEPILYFHPDERFIPADAKRYLEHCAMWAAKAPFDKVKSWSGPLAEHGTIRGISSEKAKPEEHYLNERVNNVPHLVVDTPTEERFLDLAGWRFSDPGDGSVLEQFISKPTSDQKNRFAHRDEVDRLYNDATQGQPALRDSKSWYHAELFDTDRLRNLLAERPNDRLPILPDLFDRLNNPALLCYYLFFPAHDEGLPCGNSEFASYVGDWACMAVLLERKDPQGTYMPSWIGVSGRRNLGTRQGFDERERRIAMNVRRWQNITDVHAHVLPETIDDHAKIFVAAGTHGLHLRSGTHAFNPFTPDAQPQRCGKFDSPQPTKDHSEDGFSVPGPASWYKLAAAGLLGLGPIGFAAALGWALLEDNWGVGISAVGTGSVDDEAQPDVTAEPGKLGKVIHPQSLTLTEPGAELIPWASDQVTIGQRAYSHLVDRDAQVWWPNMLSNGGFRGRWGPRCSLDPFARRAGMRFPEFWRMFFIAVAKEIAATGP